MQGRKAKRRINHLVVKSAAAKLNRRRQMNFYELLTAVAASTDRRFFRYSWMGALPAMILGRRDVEPFFCGAWDTFVYICFCSKSVENALQWTRRAFSAGFSDLGNWSSGFWFDHLYLKFTVRWKIKSRMLNLNIWLEQLYLKLFKCKAWSFKIMKTFLSSDYRKNPKWLICLFSKACYIREKHVFSPVT